MSKIIRILASVLFIFLLTGCTQVNKNEIYVSPSNTGNKAYSDMAAKAFMQSESLLTIKMTNTKNGWAVLNHAVLRTTNGGTRWSNVTPQSLISTEKVSTFFLDANNGWIIAPGEGMSGTAYHTSDGGKTWSNTSLYTSNGIKNLTFLDEKHGWLMTYLGTATGGKELVEVLRTEDGGDNWIKVSSAMVLSPQPSGLASFPLGGIKTGLGFRDPLTGWAAGKYINITGRPWIYVTYDGGHKWKPQDLELPEAAKDADEIMTYPPMFFNPQKGIIPMAFKIKTNQYLVFFNSADGGKSWAFAAPLKLSSDSTKLYTEGLQNNSAYDFLNLDTGWVADYQKIYATKDKGLTWSTIDPDEIWKKSVSKASSIKLDFITDKIGLAHIINPDHSKNLLLETSDGGHTWVRRQ